VRQLITDFTIFEQNWDTNHKSEASEKWPVLVKWPVKSCFFSALLGFGHGNFECIA